MSLLDVLVTYATFFLAILSHLRRVKSPLIMSSWSHGSGRTIAILDNDTSIGFEFTQSLRADSIAVEIAPTQPPIESYKQKREGSLESSS